MIDNFVNTKFELKFIITLTLEIFCRILWLCLEFSGGGEWLLRYRQKCKPPFIMKLHNYLNIVSITCDFVSMRYLSISSNFSPN